jgi:ATP-binding cassette, subfamily C (CFTR/MRP), member 1
MSLSIFSNLFIFFRAYTLVLSGARQGEKVHKSMMKSLLYASLGNFYNRIPIGRIINRLTKDLRELDEVIGFSIGNLLVCFFNLLSTLTICIYGSTILIIIPIVIVLLISNRVRLFYMKTQR